MSEVREPDLGKEKEYLFQASDVQQMNIGGQGDRLITIGCNNLFHLSM